MRTKQPVFFIFISIFFLLTAQKSQAQDYPYDIDSYGFINYKKNKFTIFSDTAYRQLYQKFYTLITEGKGQINVVHLGGSHIQAGTLSGYFGARLQRLFPGLKGSRGFVFPYRIARTNNPTYLRTKYSGNWENCKSTKRRQKCTLGLSGISVTTRDTSARVLITLKHLFFPHYDFQKIKIFYPNDSSSYEVDIANYQGVKRVSRHSLGYTLFEIEGHIDSLQLKFTKTSPQQNHFTLYGISLENDEPGITYHSIGINGTSIPSYLRSQLLPQHLQALNPDWVIMTLGTNDAYTRKFKPQVYKANYDSLISRIKRAVPNVNILLTVPNDSYLYRRYPNKNTAKSRDMILQVAKKYDCVVWDFYEIMGGLNSILLWQKSGLALRDKVHFTRRGYLLQGDLLFNAFLKSFDNYLENRQLQNVSP